MILSKEVELKLDLDPADVERFRALPLLAAGAGRSLRQVSTYYDTPEGDLRKAGYSLRLRRKGRRCVQTVKQKGPDSGGFSARDEWEQRIAGPGLDFAALDGTPVGKLLSKKKLRERLAVVSETRVKRSTWLVRRPRSTIELILDEGEVAAGDEREPICEIELELKAGERRRLFDLAREIGRTAPLRMGAMSKSERGFLLADGGGKRVRKAEPVVLAAEMDVAQAFATIVQSCLRHFRLNESLVAQAGKPAALHQLRVAVRRLRSAFSLFKPALAGPERDGIAHDLRWIAGLLGRARDIDVVLAAREPRPAGADRRRLKSERLAAYEAVVEALRGPRLPALILDLVAWAETGAWRRSELARRPILGFSDERLGRRWRKVRKGGRDIAAMSPEERHRLRIETKRLRYATEFMAALAAKGRRKHRRAFADLLQILQDRLGELNDIETARQLAPGSPVSGDAAVLVAQAQHAHDRLRALGPYWR